MSIGPEQMIEKIIQENLDTAKSKLLEMYEYLVDLISKSKQKSEISKKPVLIVLGEEHRAAFSGLAAMVTIAAALENGFKLFLREEDDTRNKIFNEAAEYYLQHSSEALFKTAHRGEAVIVSRQFLIQLELTFQMADFGSDGYTLLPYKDKIPPQASVIAKDGVKYRNSIMAEVLRANNQNQLILVGSEHLHGLDIEEQLSDNFELVVLDSVRFEEEFSGYTKTSLEYRKSVCNLMDSFYKGWMICHLSDNCCEIIKRMFLEKAKLALEKQNAILTDDYASSSTSIKRARRM